MKLRFTPRATKDIGGFGDYLRERSPPAATRVQAALLESLQDPLLFPQAGRSQSEPGVRKFVTPRYGYRVYYSLDEVHDEIAVLSIRHPARERDLDDA